MLLALAMLTAPASHAAPVTKLEGAPGVHFGFEVAGPGDIDGDGYADVLVGASGEPYLGVNGQISVYRGGPAGISTVPSQVLVDDPADPYDDDLGLVVEGAGDVNGDGYADVVAATRLYDGDPAYPVAQDQTGQVSLYLGSPTGLPATPSQILTAPVADGGFGWQLHHADVNLDGYSDVIVYRYADTEPDPAYGMASNAGELYVYAGSAAGTLSLISTFPVATFGLWDRVATDVRVGDVTGDGIVDWVLGWYDDGEQLAVHEGTLTGPDPVALWSYDTVDLPDNFQLSNLADADGDGVLDVQGLFIAPAGPRMESRLMTLLSTPTGLVDSGLDSPVPSSKFSQVGDMDGDGTADYASLASFHDRLLFLSADGALVPPPRRVVAGGGANTMEATLDVGDVNGDGLADVVMPSYSDHALVVEGGGLTLWMEPVVAGGKLRGVVDDGLPGDRVIVFAGPGAAQPSTCPAKLEGLCLEVPTPKIMLDSTADANGQVRFSKALPASAVAGSVWTFQAVTIRTPDWTEVQLTPPVTLTVGP